ncbi:hypothetical protein [Acinetobacter sp. YH16042]|uniref:hypothetical protein n=1 Tax=Acinetobacter sp. YH16042 TaxID=2601186 RepID=UPI0015D41A29|nr:hypothetical protein [Acinetobacter sp. YH16042]
MNRDKAENGAVMSDSEAKAKQIKRKLYHYGLHPIYSAAINPKLVQMDNGEVRTNNQGAWKYSSGGSVVTHD